MVVLNKLRAEDIKTLLARTLDRLGVAIVNKNNAKPFDESAVYIEEEAVATLAELCDGDCRNALNGLQLAVQTKRTLQSQLPEVKKQESKESLGKTTAISLGLTIDDIKGSLQKTHLLYDRAGDEHYNSISALHKSMRGSDANASLYWLSRMLCGGEDPLYVARRAIRFASEDVGMKQPCMFHKMESSVV